MTDSGQEPPKAGRVTPGTSGNSQAPKGAKGRNRRRKRRKGRTADGNTAEPLGQGAIGQGRSGEAGAFLALSGQAVSAPAGSGKGESIRTPKGKAGGHARSRARLDGHGSAQQILPAKETWAGKPQVDPGKARSDKADLGKAGSDRAGQVPEKTVQTTGEKAKRNRRGRKRAAATGKKHNALIPADGRGGGGQSQAREPGSDKDKLSGDGERLSDPSLSGSGVMDSATSAKGRKAARRRGRKRWQAGKARKGGPSESEKSSLPTQSPSGPSGLSPASQAAATPGSEAFRGRSRQRAAHAGGRETTNRQIGHGPTKFSAASHEVQKAKGGGQGLRRRASSGGNGAPLYAALDLGTNNCRLLIARPEERGFRVVDAYSRIVRLGEGVGANRRLSDAAMDRAIDALANCHRKLAERGVGRSRLIATEACRAAENGEDFIGRVQAETGLALEVVDRETEARLAVAGCASLVDPEADGVILFDIGGGSSEIVWLDLRNRCGARGYALTRFIRSWISLPVGVVNLAERHGGVHVTPDIFENMVDDAANHLSAFNLADNLSDAIGSGRVHMLGTSGTVTTLAGVHLGLRRYDRRRVDGTWLDDRDVGRMIDQLRDMPYEARVENPCIGADRADLVLAGCAILEAIRRRWSCPRLRVADRGLREGILTELMAADGVWSRNRASRRGRPRNR